MRWARGYFGDVWSVATGVGAGRFNGRAPSLRIALVKRAKILRSGTVTTVNRFGSTEIVALMVVESVSCGRSETAKSAAPLRACVTSTSLNLRLYAWLAR